MSWKACLHANVAMSTIEAEYMAIAEAMDEGLWLEGLFLSYVVLNLTLPFIVIVIVLFILPKIIC
jgi:hypothetical protein